MTRTREENAADLQREEEEGLSVEFLPIQDGAITTPRPYQVQLVILAQATIMAPSEEEALMEAKEIVDTLGVIDNINREELAVLLTTIRI